MYRLVVRCVYLFVSRSRVSGTQEHQERNRRASLSGRLGNIEYLLVITSIDYCLRICNHTLLVSLREVMDHVSLLRTFHLLAVCTYLFAYVSFLPSVCIFVYCNIFSFENDERSTWTLS